VQNPFLSFFCIDWLLIGVRTIKTRDRNSSETSNCEWLQHSFEMEFIFKWEGEGKWLWKVYLCR